MSVVSISLTISKTDLLCLRYGDLIACIRFGRLSEASDNNLGLACTEQGLFLGRTSLIERRNSRFVVRERHEIGRLFYKAYAAEPPLDRLMHGLANVAAALNANDQCLARIAAVHLCIPDLPNEAARAELEAADILIKWGDWNPALHPRTGTLPNPGWFGPTDGPRLRHRFAWRKTKSRIKARMHRQARR